MRSARSLFLVVVVASLALAPAGGADAARRFTFYGSGWGHGVGLSQWGAYGLAQDGWGARRILTHFYTGTRVHRAQHPPAKIRARRRPNAHSRQIVEVEHPCAGSRTLGERCRWRLVNARLRSQHRYHVGWRGIGAAFLAGGETKRGEGCEEEVERDERGASEHKRVQCVCHAPTL